MGQRIYVVCTVLFSLIHNTESSAVWGYDTQGLRPGEWYLLYPSCGGRRQSPVDIYPERALYDPTLEPFQLNGLRDLTNVKINLINKDYTVEVRPYVKPLKVTGGNLTGSYVVDQLHFHWGSEINIGSEHEYNGGYYPMEMHLVLHAEQFSSSEKAMNTGNGLAVLGVFVQIGRHNRAFDVILNNLDRIQQKGSSVIIPTFDFSTLFPSTQYYYRYYGSLTTPPCYESVIWTIFRDVVYISEAQLRKFQALGQSPTASQNLVDNFRDPQPLNGRIVRTNYAPYLE